MFLSNLLPEIGIHFFISSFLVTGNLVIVDIPYLNVEEGPHPSCKFDSLFSRGARRTLNSYT